MSKNKIEKAQIALDEMRRMYDKLDENSATLDSKSHSLLSSSGIIITLFGAVQLSISDNSVNTVNSVPEWFQGGLFVLLVFFFLLLILVFLATRPREYLTPFAADWTDINNALEAHKKMNVTIDMVTSRYRNKIVANEEKNKEKAKFYRWAYIVYIITILIIGVLSINLIF